MTFSREALIQRSVNYFEGCNRHEHDMVMATFSEDCLMWFPAATFTYAGKRALDIHFKDFLSTFKVINFHNFKHICDPEAQSICTYFTVDLVQQDDVETRMRNCNIFILDDDGTFSEIIIYNSGKLDAGFHNGSQ